MTKNTGHATPDCPGAWIDITALQDTTTVEKCSHCRGVRRGGVEEPLEKADWPEDDGYDEMMDQRDADLKSIRPLYLVLILFAVIVLGGVALLLR